MDKNNLIFLSGAELPDKTILTCCQAAELDTRDTPHTLFRGFTSEKEILSLGHGNWISTGISASPTGNGVVSLGPEGEFLDLQLDGSHIRNNVLDNFNHINSTFRFIKLIDGILYAGGTNNYIFSFIDNEWSEIGTKAMRKEPVPRSFENATGFHAEELYTFGWKGAIWTNSSGKWKKIPSPTEYILYDGDVHQDHVYIGGQLGTILKGRDDKWKVIQTGLNVDIWSVKSFEDSVYFSTIHGILRLQNGKLTVFKDLGPDMRTARNLFVGPSGLWSVGASDIALYDGKQWHSIKQNLK
jgi:hypothetical protein